MTPDLQHLYDQITCAQIEREEARRTVFVPGPATAVKLEAWLAAHGIDDIIAVRCSSLVAPGTMLIVDERAIEAGTAEVLQGMARESIKRLRAPTCVSCGQHGYGGRIWHRLGCPVEAILRSYAFGMGVMSPRLSIITTGT